MRRNILVIKQLNCPDYYKTLCDCSGCYLYYFEDK